MRGPQNTRVGVVGLGYVGLTVAAALAKEGLIVHGFEVDERIVASLRDGRAHFAEPGLDEVLKVTIGANFTVQGVHAPQSSFDIIILTVGTPLRPGENRGDLEYLRQGLTSAALVARPDTLFVLRSTVPVGTTRSLAVPVLAEGLGIPSEEVMVAFCPERTAEGAALRELRELPQIISGNNLVAAEQARAFFGFLSDQVVEASSLEEAELAKLFCNVYRDTWFALANAFNGLAQELHLDGVHAIDVAREGYPRAGLAAPGFVGGPCLSKDTYLLAQSMESRHPAIDWLISARELNRKVVQDFAETIRSEILQRSTALHRPLRVVVSGLAFKGVPETSDLRDSPAKEILYMIQPSIGMLKLHDFAAELHDLAAELGCDMVEELDGECCDADMLVILNNHPRYAAIRSDWMATQAPGVSHVFDAWGATGLSRSDAVEFVTIGDFRRLTPDTECAEMVST